MKVNVIPPNQWKVALYANVGNEEEFVNCMLEIAKLVDGTDIFDPQRGRVKEAILSIMMDGLIPAFLELRQIRESVSRVMPLMDREQLYEDFARKLWKAYKHHLQTAVNEMGLNIGFLFENDKRFKEGLTAFHATHPDVRPWFENLLESTRNNWQNDLAKFRNSWIEHQTGDRRRYQQFYSPQYAEQLFEKVWRTITDILPALVELHFGDGIRLVEQEANDPGPRWQNRFRFHIPNFHPNDR